MYLRKIGGRPSLGRSRTGPPPKLRPEIMRNPQKFTVRSSFPTKKQCRSISYRFHDDFAVRMWVQRRQLTAVWWARLNYFYSGRLASVATPFRLSEAIAKKELQNIEIAGCYSLRVDVQRGAQLAGGSPSRKSCDPRPIAEEKSWEKKPKKPHHVSLISLLFRQIKKDATPPRALAYRASNEAVFNRFLSVVICCKKHCFVLNFKVIWIAFFRLLGISKRSAWLERNCKRIYFFNQFCSAKFGNRCRFHHINYAFVGKVVYWKVIALCSCDRMTCSLRSNNGYLSWPTKIACNWRFSIEKKRTDHFQIFIQLAGAY